MRSGKWTAYANIAAQNGSTLFVQSIGMYGWLFCCCCCCPCRFSSKVFLLSAALQKRDRKIVKEPKFHWSWKTKIWQQKKDWNNLHILLNFLFLFEYALSIEDQQSPLYAYDTSNKENNIFFLFCSFFCADFLFVHFACFANFFFFLSEYLLRRNAYQIEWHFVEFCYLVFAWLVRICFCVAHFCVFIYFFFNSSSNLSFRFYRLDDLSYGSDFHLLITYMEYVILWHCMCDEPQRTNQTTTIRK